MRWRGRKGGRTPIISVWEILPLSSLSNIEKALCSRAFCELSSRSIENSSACSALGLSLLFCIEVDILRKGFFGLSRL